LAADEKGKWNLQGRHYQCKDVVSLSMIQTTTPNQRKRKTPMDKDLQNLIDRFKDFPVVERKPSFLDIARFPHRETVWRNIFAFFFNPKECHGFKDLFLRSFFDALGETDQSTGNLDSMTVRTECQTGKGNFLDLLITCDEFAIGIEMKVNANLYNDLGDYGRLIDIYTPAGLAYMVVLSNAQCQPDAGFVNLRYSAFIASIKQQIGNYVLASDPKYTSLLLDFLNHVSSYIGGYAMPVDPKQLQFMQDNHVVVNRLFEVHNNLQRQLKERMALINEAVVASQKEHVSVSTGVFDHQNRTIAKIKFRTTLVQIWLEFSITPDYCLIASFWTDDQHPQHTSLDRELKVAGIIAPRFDLMQPVEENVASIETLFGKIVDYLNKKQIPATGQ